MKALVIAGPKEYSLQDVDIPDLAAGHALVKMKAAALNRRDYWIGQGKYPNINWGSILGSDGCGVVTEVYDQNDSQWLDKEVVIYPGVGWGDNPKVQAPDYEVLGMPTNGTFAEYMAVPIGYLQPKPDHLSVASAAAVPLAGLTAYRSIFTQGQIQAGQKVLVTGIGGGVSQMAFVLALSAKAEVYVASRSDEKIVQAKASGAKEGFNSRHEDWTKIARKTTGGFDLIIDSVGGDTMNDLLKIAKPAGKVVFYGATLGPAKNLDLFRIFWNQITLQGTTMGTEQEFADMLAWFSKHQLQPVVDSVRPFNQIIAAIDRMGKGEQTGKLVVEF